MRSKSLRKSIASLGVSALVATLAVVSVPAANAAPICATAGGVETCGGKLANGASYVFKVPTNFKGTMFFWEHGFRSTYPIPGVVSVPTGIDEITPGNSITGTDVTAEMLRAGHGLAAYEGSVMGLRAWNNTYRIEMLKEVIDIATAHYGSKIKHKDVYGAS